MLPNLYQNAIILNVRNDPHVTEAFRNLCNYSGQPPRQYRRTVRHLERRARRPGRYARANPVDRQ